MVTIKSNNLLPQLINVNNLKSLKSSCKIHDTQPVREAVSYRGLFTAGWFGMREKHCSG